MNEQTELFDLDVIDVASPCPAHWADMEGDERVRHCLQCEKNVYNLSEMPRQEALELVQRMEGNLCVRFFRRADGTVLTQDCPVGLRALQRRLVRSAMAVVAVVCMLALAPVFALSSEFRRRAASSEHNPLALIKGWVSKPPAATAGCVPTTTNSPVNFGLVTGKIAMPQPLAPVPKKPTGKTE